MPAIHRRPAGSGVLAAATAVALAAVGAWSGAAVAAPAAAPPATAPLAQAATPTCPGTNGVRVPTVTSNNIRQVAGLPGTVAISIEFARTGPFAYVSSTERLTALDISDPCNPKVLGTMPNALFENESMTYGERMVNG